MKTNLSVFLGSFIRLNKILMTVDIWWNFVKFEAHKKISDSSESSSPREFHYVLFGNSSESKVL